VSKQTTMPTSEEVPGTLADSGSREGVGARVQFQDVLHDVIVRSVDGDVDVEVAGLSYDSRRVHAGDCFACIPGIATDGHDYAPDAVAAGAVALLVERSVDVGGGVTQAHVESVRRALGPAASRLHGYPSKRLLCLGVTGTNGKTTTTYLLEACAVAAGERAGLIGTTGARVNGEPVEVGHTTPEATELQALLARMCDAGVTTVALEVSSHALDQHRIDGTWFEVVGFTNLSQDHLDYHGTLGAYYEAKAALFDPARAAAAAISIDDAYGHELRERAEQRGLPTTTFALDDAEADVVADDVVFDPTGTRFVLHDRRSGARGAVELSLFGRFNVANALTAATMALIAGTPFESVVEGLSRPIVIPGRLERVDAGQPFVVLVDYAHTPAALSSSLDAARTLATGRVIVVFGCGGDRDRDKRPLMGRAAGMGADVAVLTSDNPRSESATSIADEVLEGLEGTTAQLRVELDRRAAIADALAAARSGDVVVIAGKGHETEQTIGDVSRPFDDRVVARAALEARA
jgi:UDP-N-acetylmuramoyl-L-alanyl-D-glutamate--2,6-diaminopimelate ligase